MHKVNDHSVDNKILDLDSESFALFLVFVGDSLHDMSRNFVNDNFTF